MNLRELAKGLATGLDEAQAKVQEMADAAVDALANLQDVAERYVDLLPDKDFNFESTWSVATDKVKPEPKPETLVDGLTAEQLYDKLTEQSPVYGDEVVKKYLLENTDLLVRAYKVMVQDN